MCNLNRDAYYCDSGGNPMIGDKIKNMLASPIKEMQALGKVLKEEQRVKDNLYISLIKNIQEKYPQVIVTGSSALYLHGVKLKRWKTTSSSDLDIIIPYYIKFEDFSEYSFSRESTAPESNDFDYGVLVSSRGNTVKLDIRIDPKQRYEFIEMDDFRFKVSVIETIILAKIKYSLSGGQKHKDDIYEILGKDESKKDSYNFNFS